MTDREKKIMETCGKMLPRLTESEKKDFLSFTEGMAFLSEYRIHSTGTSGQQGTERPGA